MPRPKKTEEEKTKFIGFSVPVKWYEFVEAQLSKAREKGHMATRAELWRKIAARYFESKGQDLL